MKRVASLPFYALLAVQVGRNTVKDLDPGVQKPGSIVEKSAK